MSLFLVPSRSSSTPPLPPLVLRVREHTPGSQHFSLFDQLRLILSLTRSSGLRHICFATKNSQMRYIGLFTSPSFLWGLWLKNFHWALILDVNHRVHLLGPKLQVKSLCTNHASITFHDGPIGSFCNSILLWCVRNTCLSLDSTFTQKVAVTYSSHHLTLAIAKPWCSLHF